MNKLLERLLPATALGWWSLGLAIASPILFVIGGSFADGLYASVEAGGTILADIAARPALALTMLAGMLAGVAALIIGFLAISRQKERAILAYLSTAYGVLLTVFLIGELVFPH